MIGPLRALLTLWSRLSIYLPLLIMGGLGLMTYWLYRNTPETTAAAAPPSARHEADYFMKGFSLRTLGAQGILKSEVRGARLQHFPDTDTLEIDQVQIHSYNQQRQLTTATATKAISNADGSEVQLIGNANVVRNAFVNTNGVPQPRLVFQGEFLHVFVNTEQIKSHKPVLILRGNDRIEASRLDFNYLDRVARFEGRVTATFGSRNGKP